MKRVKYFTLLFNMIFSIFMLLMIFNTHFSLPIYHFIMIIALIIIAIHSSFFIYMKRRNKSTIFHFNGIISGIILFLNPVLGSLVSSISLILFSIIMCFKL